jgi:hypothetical protein
MHRKDPQLRPNEDEDDERGGNGANLIVVDEKAPWMGQIAYLGPMAAPRMGRLHKREHHKSD